VISLNNIKHIHIKIITTSLCTFVALQLLGCSAIDSFKIEDSSSQQSSAVSMIDTSSSPLSSSDVSSTIQSSQLTISSSGLIASSSSLIVSSSKQTLTSKFSSSIKASSPISSNTASSSSKHLSNNTVQVAAYGSPANTDPSLYKPLTFSETRGVWVATVGYIDFPQTATGTTNQKQMIIKILEDAKKYGLNTVFFQVRPMSDAFYKSGIYPWSKYLTGTRGKDPGYDPLAYFIEEAHKKNIAVQVWINPYRVCAQNDYSTLNANNPAKIHHDWTVTYTDSDKKQNWIWFNPGLPEVRELVTQGVTEIVKNYDIDGVHFDDYFYPYSSTYYDNSAAYSGIKFDDSAAFKQYGNGMSIADWRRNNVNLLVKQVHDAIKSVNGNTQFGISPFGIWATKSVMPQGTDTSGMSSYSVLYADSRLWVTKHWVDYICPQIYWGFNQPSKPHYDVMVDWWSELCAQSGVALYIGHRSDIVKSGTNMWTNSNGVNQIQYARQKSAYKGSVYFSYNSLSSISPLFKGLYY
jgi:uncharacterized lipoprotein YddW (UPF0748 family)